MTTRPTAVLLGAILFLFLLFAGFLDYLGAATLIPMIMASFAIAGLAVGGLFWIRGNSRSVVGLVAIYFLALVVLRLVAIGPTKPFRAFYRSVEPGMSEATVLAELEERFPEPGRFRRPTVYRPEAGGLTLTLDRTDWRYNSEIVRVELSGGRVVSKDYLPD